MAGCNHALFAVHLTLLCVPATAGQLRLRQHRLGNPVIPNTDVEMPDDFNDPNRGQTPWELFPNLTTIPGGRVADPSQPSGVPGFYPKHPELSPETYIMADGHGDFINWLCSPGHVAVGHVMYNVWIPEVVPFIVPLGAANRTDLAIIVAPGGGSGFLAWDVDGIPTVQWLNSIGISAFLLKYRVPSETMDIQVMDSQRAISVVRSRALEFGLNPDRVGFMGFSHGGGLTIEVAARTQRTYQPVDAVDSVSCHPDYVLVLYGEVPDDLPEDLSAFPKTFIAFTDDDPCCFPVITRGLVDQLRKVMNPDDLFVEEFPTGGHGWSSCDMHPSLRGEAVCTWKDLAENWLDTEVLNATR